MSKQIRRKLFTLYSLVEKMQQQAKVGVLIVLLPNRLVFHTIIARVVKRARNSIALFAKLRTPSKNRIALFAKLRKPQFTQLRKLRKLRVAICDFCENCECSSGESPVSFSITNFYAYHKLREAVTIIAYIHTRKYSFKIEQAQNNKYRVQHFLDLASKNLTISQ